MFRFHICFISSYFAAVSFTIISKTSIIFLQRAESSNGQTDILLTNKVNDYLNYSAVIENTKDYHHILS